MHELPLILFTVLSETAVGMICTLVVLQLMGKIKKGNTVFVIGLVATIIAGVAALCSMGHLGKIDRAINSIMNLGSSWLSREILFVGLFVVAALIYAILGKVGAKTAEGEEVAAPSSTSKIVGIIAAIIGLCLVLITSLCYMLPGVPAWNGALTPIQFFATLACGVFLALALKEALEGGNRVALWLILFVVCLVAFFFLRNWFYSQPDAAGLLIDQVASRI